MAAHMSGINGNGGEHEEEDDTPSPPIESLRAVDLTQPQALRRALLEVVNYTHESFKSSRFTARLVKRMSEERADTDAQVLKTLAAIQQELHTVHALALGTSARVHRLDNEKELPLNKLGDIQKDVATMRIKINEENPAAAKLREENETRFLSFEKRLDQLEDDQETTGQRVTTELALAGPKQELAVARARLESLHEHEVSKLTEHRVTRQETHKWKLGVTGAIFLLLLGAAVSATATYYLGPQSKGITIPK